VSRRGLALALWLLTAGLANAEACLPSPLGTRELFLRGTMNNWGAPEAQRLRYVCNRYELVTRLQGEHSFKIADEDWSADADLGGGNAGRLQPKGPALQQRFEPGYYQLTLRLNGEAPQLSIAAASAQEASPPPADEITDPVARSVRFDSRNPAHKKPFGAITAGSEVSFRISARRGVEQATLVIEQRRLEGNQQVLDYLPVARVPMRPTANGWQARYRFADKAIYGYHFELQIAGKRYRYQNNRDDIYWTREKGSMGLGRVDEIQDEPAPRIRRYRQTVYAADFKVPDWARDAVYYYVFPERFRNGDKRNDPQPGVARYHAHSVERHARWNEKPAKPGSGDGSDTLYNNDFFGGDLAGLIDKLDYIQALGANTLYLTPVFKAASNHKYDTADYRRIDPGFGTNEDFQRLTAEAARRGLRVIPDTSLNHVGSDSPYFNRFGNYPAGGAFDGGRPNPASPYADWFSFDTAHTEADQQYKGWLGVPDLPELNKASAGFRAFAYGAPDSVSKLWLDRGASGWRMDVAPWVPDDFWREWRAAVKAHQPDALTIAETWFDASKFFLGDAFDSTMNYIFRNTVLDYAAGGPADRLYANIELMREAYPPQTFYALMNLLSTHDQPRALHHFGYHDDGNAQQLAEAKQRLRLAVFFQMVFPGAPSIYYGDEVGLGGGDDPYNRAPYPWVDEGGAPDEALLADFKRLTRLRRDHAVLRHGSIGAPLHLDAHAIVLARQDGRRWALSATNNAIEPRRLTLTLPPALRDAEFVDALSGERLRARGTQLTIEIPALFGRVLLWN
jgi:cyclomaltodextrinase